MKFGDQPRVLATPAFRGSRLNQHPEHTRADQVLLPSPELLEQSHPQPHRAQAAGVMPPLAEPPRIGLLYPRYTVAREIEHLAMGDLAAALC